MQLLSENAAPAGKRNSCRKRAYQLAALPVAALHSRQYTSVSTYRRLPWSPHMVEPNHTATVWTGRLQVVMVRSFVWLSHLSTVRLLFPPVVASFRLLLDVMVAVLSGDGGCRRGEDLRVCFRVFGRGRWVTGFLPVAPTWTIYTSFIFWQICPQTIKLLKF